MKKSPKLILVVLLATLLLIAPLLTGCKNDDDNKDSNENKNAEAPDYSDIDVFEHIELGAYTGIEISAGADKGSTALALWEQIVDNARVIKYPQKALDYYLEQTIRRYQHYASEGNMDYEEILLSLGLTENDIENEAKGYVKSDLVELAIIKSENISLSNEEKEKFLDRYIENYVSTYRYSKDYVRNNLIEEVYSSMLHDKMLEYLLLKNTISEEKQNG